MGKIRDHAKSTGLEVIGKLSLMGKWDGFGNRYYMDEGGNAFIVDAIIGCIRIIPKKKACGIKPQT